MRARRQFSLPPCGGGWGGGSGGDAQAWTLSRHLTTPTPTPPHKSLRPGARKRGPGGEGNWSIR